ncbi:MAG TPA: hypothetical protein VK804_32885 [Bradyrhizobium sp.]|uniref:hypothetical protein n=1 Tax=Bradyrhizobium sp. TaxID=376 RepID=UPI002CC69339|nr:hypothetical protein [Bradyrhizobium sp.]HTB05296.1 hypothetical protein [Bradyrhizobium sp.]
MTPQLHPGYKHYMLFVMAGLVPAIHVFVTEGKTYARRKGGHDGALSCLEKKQGAVGITTTAPHVAGLWGRGDDRLPG